MGKMQRTKGATFEREVAALLRDGLARPTKRMLGQARDGGHDLEQIGPWIFECKRYAKIAVYQWLKQVWAAGAFGQCGVVIARADQEEPIVIMYLEDWMLMARAYLEQQEEPVGL